MRFWILSVAIFASFAILFGGNQAFSLGDSCQSHTICAVPGNIIKYEISSGGIAFSKIYNFDSMLDADHIKIIEQDQSNQSQTANSTLRLNTKTGFVSTIQDLQNSQPFIEVLATPIIYNDTDTSITKILTDYDKFKRTAIVVFHSGDNSTLSMTYDLESGILLEAHSSSIVMIQNQPELVTLTNKLAYTNMINSDSPGLNHSDNIAIIPSWVKNTSKFWSQGQIQDTDFVKSLQYLIANGIIQVPHDTSGVDTNKQIPSWIKKDAGWWADGQISQEEFIKCIQWLITNGIIQV